MSDPSTLGLFLRDLVNRYEERHGVRLSPDETSARFGEGIARTITGVLAGRAPRHADEMAAAVAALEGDDEDVGTALQFCPEGVRSERAPEEIYVLNARIVERLARLERFLRESGQYDAYRAWAAENRDRE
ncbi:MAG: hypothetical protein R3F20_11455 [Planctomycetota bacterium]